MKQFNYKDKTWKHLRERHLDINPYCVLCNGTFYLHVDHIVEHYNDYDLYTDSENLQTLCISCHGSKSSQQTRLYNVRQGSYSIIIHTNVDNIVYNEYSDYFGNKRKVIQQLVKETIKDKVVIINCKNISLGLLREFLYGLIILGRELPIKITSDSPEKKLIKDLIDNILTTSNRSIILPQGGV